MKILKITFIILLITQQGYTQSKKVTANVKHTYDASSIKGHDISYSHITDSNNIKFLGTWVSQKGKSQLIICLKDSTYNLGTENKPVLIDAIIGGYKLIENKKIKADLLNSTVIKGGTEGKDNMAYISIYNKLTRRNIEYILTYVDNYSIKLTLSTRQHEYSKNENELGLPVNILLKKN